jgi:protein TonB
VQRGEAAVFGFLEPEESAASRWSRMGGSVLAHVVALTILGQAAWWMAKRLPSAGTAEGSRAVLLSGVGRPSVAAKNPQRAVRRPKTPPKVVLATMTPPSEVATIAATPSAHPDDREGSDARGGGNVNISYVQSFPLQRPDLSRLPVGSSGDVVVDVLIDERGRVSNARTRQGMGYGIDEMVIATVEQWVFYPATKNGKPVASEQELHFHYDRGRGMSACGWDCFQLAER